MQSMLRPQFLLLFALPFIVKLIMSADDSRGVG